LNFFNILLALVFFEISTDSSRKRFILFNLGGMTFRLFLLLILIFLTIKFLIIDIDEFILVFFVFYFIQLIIELLHFSKYRELNKNNGT
jgi:hypothetical protein